MNALTIGNFLGILGKVTEDFWDLLGNRTETNL